MARVTIEDCKVNVPNKFDLVVLAARRVSDALRLGAKPIIQREGDKDHVIALREIAFSLELVSILKEECVNSYAVSHKPKRDASKDDEIFSFIEEESVIVKQDQEEMLATQMISEIYENQDSED